jgi:hypothetical protein
LSHCPAIFTTFTKHPDKTIHVREALIKPSLRRKPVSSAMILLDSGFRRNDDMALDQRFLGAVLQAKGDL